MTLWTHSLHTVSCLFFVSSGTSQDHHHHLDNLHSAFMTKGHLKYFCKRVHGQKTRLQDENSDVILFVPEDKHGLLIGCIHTELTPFLTTVPDTECFVSPVPEFQFFPDATQGTTRKHFTVQIPYSGGSIDQLKVYHGDIYRKIPFTRLANADFDCHPSKNAVDIHTRHFSQFICTMCKNDRKAQLRALIYGSVFPFCNEYKSVLKVHLGSSLYVLRDFPVFRVSAK